MLTITAAFQVLHAAQIDAWNRQYGDTRIPRRLLPAPPCGTEHVNTNRTKCLNGTLTKGTI